MSDKINGVLHGAEYLWPEGSEWDGPPDMKRLAFLWGKVREWQAAGSPRVPDVPSAEALEDAAQLLVVDSTDSDTGRCTDESMRAVADFLRGLK